MRTEGWLAGETLATVAPARRGAEVLVVDDSRAITPGEMVLLEVDRRPERSNHRMLREMGGDVEGALVVSLGRPRNSEREHVALARRGHRRALAAARPDRTAIADLHPPRDPGPSAASSDRPCTTAAWRA